MAEERAQNLIKQLHDAVVKMDEEASAQLSKTILAEGIDANRAITEGLTAAMSKVGELYTNQEYWVPELLLCSDALYAALDILKPKVKVEEAQVKGQIVLGVVEGDMHDIGKNLVKVMLDAAGWTVYDLGRDVQLERFVEEQQRTNADIVALSALMTTSMLAMPKVIQMMKACDPNAAVMVGGAPLTREIASSYGADGYAKTAVDAVAEAVKLLKPREKK